MADVIFQFGEERHSRRIARAHRRARGRVTTTGQLASIVRRAVPTRGWQRIDPATRTFQALRIWVNGELDGLDRFVQDAASRLREGGRLVVITFHSLEDRIVKHTMRGLAQADDGLQVLTKKPLVPSDAERDRNPRSRSAKLRGRDRSGRHGSADGEGGTDGSLRVRDQEGHPEQPDRPRSRRGAASEMWRSASVGASARRDPSLLGVAALRVDPLRLSDRADAARTCRRGAGEPAPEAEHPDADAGPIGSSSSPHQAEDGAAVRRRHLHPRARRPERSARASVVAAR